MAYKSSHFRCSFSAVRLLARVSWLVLGKSAPRFESLVGPRGAERKEEMKREKKKTEEEEKEKEERKSRVRKEEEEEEEGTS